MVNISRTHGTEFGEIHEVDWSSYKGSELRGSKDGSERSGRDKEVVHTGEDRPTPGQYERFGWLERPDMQWESWSSVTSSSVIQRLCQPLEAALLSGPTSMVPPYLQVSRAF